MMCFFLVFSWPSWCVGGPQSTGPGSSSSSLLVHLIELYNPTPPQWSWQWWSGSWPCREQCGSPQRMEWSSAHSGKERCGRAVWSPSAWSMYGKWVCRNEKMLNLTARNTVFATNKGVKGILIQWHAVLLSSLGLIEVIVVLSRLAPGVGPSLPK